MVAGSEAASSHEQTRRPENMRVIASSLVRDGDQYIPSLALRSEVQILSILHGDLDSSWRSLLHQVPTIPFDLRPDEYLRP